MTFLISKFIRKENVQCSPCPAYITVEDLKLKLLSFYFGYIIDIRSRTFLLGQREMATVNSKSYKWGITDDKDVSVIVLESQYHQNGVSLQGMNWGNMNIPSITGTPQFFKKIKGRLYQ